MLNDATLVTNGTSNNNLTMVLNARGSSEVSVSNSTLDNSRSWILGNFHDHSKLIANTTTNIPTEIYPEDSSQATLVNSTVSNIWLKFLPSSSANVTLPSVDGDGKFSLAFGSSSGANIDYQVNITNSKSALGFNSLPNSTLNLTGGGGGTNPTVVIGYFIINNPSPMTVSGLAVGLVASKTLNDLGRTLSLKNVDLGKFGWQIYCQNNSAGLVTIKNSFVNELGAFQNSNVRVENSTLQLADLAAAAPTSQVVVDKSDIWSHSVQATNGGSLTIDNSTIHGNLFTASGCSADHCSTITLTHVTEANNGVQSTCLGAKWLKSENTPQAAANMFQPDGTPNCDPLNPLQAPSRFVTSNGGVINK